MAPSAPVRTATSGPSAAILTLAPVSLASTGSPAATSWYPPVATVGIAEIDDGAVATGYDPDGEASGDSAVPHATAPHATAAASITANNRAPPLTRLTERR